MSFFLQLQLSLKEAKLSFVCCTCSFQDAALLKWKLRCCWNHADSLPKLCTLLAILGMNPKESRAFCWKLWFLYAAVAIGCQ